MYESRKQRMGYRESCHLSLVRNVKFIDSKKSVGDINNFDTTRELHTRLLQSHRLSMRLVLLATANALESTDPPVRIPTPLADSHSKASNRVVIHQTLFFSIPHNILFLCIDF